MTYTCEYCGIDDLSDEEYKKHVEAEHPETLTNN
jgi:hypothetical protein